MHPSNQVRLIHCSNTPLLQTLNQPNQIPIRILHNKLSLPNLAVVNPIPSVRTFAVKRVPRLAKLVNNRRDSDDIDLQIDPPSKRLAQRRSELLAGVRVYLLKHHLSAVQIEVGKPILWTLISHFETQAMHPERQAGIQVSDHQFRDQFVAFEHDEFLFSRA